MGPGGHGRVTRAYGASPAIVGLRVDLPGTPWASRGPAELLGRLGLLWVPESPRASLGDLGPPCVSVSFGEHRAAARASPCSRWFFQATLGSGRGRRSVLRSPVPYLHPSALPVPYQCLTSALPSALPREPYEFTRRALPIHKRVLLLRQGRRVDLEDRTRPACKFIRFAR